MNEENSSPDPDQRLTTRVGEIILTADRNAVILRLGERESLIWYQTGQEGWPFQVVMSPQDAIDIGTQLVRHGEKVLNRTE